MNIFETVRNLTPLNEAKDHLSLTNKAHSASASAHSNFTQHHHAMAGHAHTAAHLAHQEALKNAKQPEDKDYHTAMSLHHHGMMVHHTKLSK